MNRRDMLLTTGALLVPKNSVNFAENSRFSEDFHPFYPSQQL